MGDHDPDDELGQWSAALVEGQWVSPHPWAGGASQSLRFSGAIPPERQGITTADGVFFSFHAMAGAALAYALCPWLEWKIIRPAGLPPEIRMDVRGPSAVPLPPAVEGG